MAEEGLERVSETFRKRTELDELSPIQATQQLSAPILSIIVPSSLKISVVVEAIEEEGQLILIFSNS